MLHHYRRLIVKPPIMIARVISGLLAPQHEANCDSNLMHRFNASVNSIATLDV